MQDSRYDRSSDGESPTPLHPVRQRSPTLLLTNAEYEAEDLDTWRSVFIVKDLWCRFESRVVGLWMWRGGDDGAMAEGIRLECPRLDIPNI